MRNHIIISIGYILGCMFATVVRAEKLPDYRSAISRDSICIREGQVEVFFTLDLGEYIVHSQHQRIITPVLRTADGKHEQLLPPVIVNGRNRAIKELRKGTYVPNVSASEGDNEQVTPAAYCILTGNKRENRYTDYHTTTDYYPWMEQARFSLREEVLGCACGGLLQAEQVVKKQALYAPQIELSAQQECPVEYVPRREQRDAYLIYPVNKTVLHPELYGNRRELQKIDSALSFVHHNPDYEIKHIDIAGYASPEGNLKHNIKLSEGRAAALKEYIARNYSFADTLMTVTPGAENWDGLVEALKTYELPYKEEILNTIATVNDLDEREAAIRLIGGGLPYKTLLNAIYPGLRKNTFTISYISKERTPEKARELVFDNPAELNVHEFYTVADTFYADDKPTYNRVLKAAADTYPAHSVANNNAARACIEEGDLEQAEHYLLHTQNEPFTWNNRGCLLWKQGNTAEAILWWKKAADNGDEAAAQNLKELARRGY